MSLYLHLFGVMRLADGERAINPAPLPKCAALLAYLALNEGRFVPRKEVAFKLWPDDEEDVALGRLRRHLHELMGALPLGEVPWILVDRANVGWNTQAPWANDVARFDRCIGTVNLLGEAVAIYDGDLAEDLEEEWLEPYRRRYRQRAVEALEALCAQAWLEHDANAAIGCMRHLLSIDPLRENAVRRLMAMLAQTGDRAGALRVYTQFAAALHDEIGVEPMPRTRATYEAVLAGIASVIFPNNLPAHLTPFMGREHALAAVVKRLQKTRLLTITGPGGAGKTRLALAAAAFLGAAYEDGIYFIDLSGSSDARTVLNAFGSPFDAGAHADPIAALTARFADKRMLLIADNCEHVVECCGPLCERLLRGAPNLSIVATSRMPLRLHGEALFTVPELTAREARELFTARSHAPVSSAESATIDEICSRLDGLPLAVELAAAATASLDLAAIETRVSAGATAVEFTSRTDVERHRTLDATITWSVALLSDSDRGFFESMAAFTPSFTLDAAARVGGQATSAAARAVGRLREASMLQSSAIDGSPRFRLLDTIRTVALARLHERPDRGEVYGRHGVYFSDLVAQAQPHFTDDRQAEWLARLDAESANLDAALRWSFETPGNAARGIAMASGLRRFWEFRGYYAQANHWLTLALESTDAQTHERVEILTALGKLQVYVGDMHRALERCTEAETLARAIGDEPGLTFAQASHAYALLHRGDRAQARRLLDTVASRLGEEKNEHALAATLGNIAFDDMHNGDLEAAQRRYEQALAIFEHFGDRRQCGWMLYQLGRLALCRSEFVTAHELFERSLEIRRLFGDRRGIVETLCSLGEVAFAQRGADRAEALFEQGYRLSCEIGWRRGLAMAIEGRAAVASLRGQAHEAVQLIGAAGAYREAYNLFIPPADRIAHDALVGHLLTQLGAPAFEEATVLGRSRPIMAD